ncbi:Hypothetical protein NGAL_HAMBI2605_12070 [Neorhizobium galegae bv. orientalis]|uniref:hypothetical protein n=1 Tax=Neorhizobium galegae TaxID=399 RepID=UPI00062161CE|nr:hypothetical protein [Neorhizobium galegae]MCQ1835945.1 hypothetical protein [Neorhizobium galegae]UIY28494.1 hypothetical protein LZK73_16785 [Neorhizobium galegae]CDZ60813.1 Hypothetical protein NGAL_HAMBI2605_12070 [Neorhizobium galegae bv. orientalis]CDZ69455.1 Hypothetical protein NGAL_HAMBI2610_10540 [Neorhizobium galegae bv. orientalis]
MLFGQSVFQSVLTRLKQEHGEGEAEEAGTGFRIKGLGMGFVAPQDDGPVVTATGTEAYFAFLPDVAEIGIESVLAQEQPPAPVIPAHLLRLTTEEIAAELDITAADTEATLGEKRRHFAKANHPDGVAPEFRENANTRMKTANLLIDTAIKGLFWR